MVRDARTLAPIRRVPAWGLHIGSAISPDGRFAALAREDGSLRIAGPANRLDPEPAGPARRTGGEHGVLARRQHTRHRGDDEKVVVWDVRSAQPRGVFEGHAARITSVALSPDGRTVYSASLDGTVIAWDLEGSRQLGRQFAVSRVGKAGPRFSETLSARASVGPGTSAWPRGATCSRSRPTTGS